MIIDKIVLAFTPPQSTGEVQQSEREALADIVASHSHGNIRLQQGKYYTADDVNKQFEEVRNVRFSGD